MVGLEPTDSSERCAKHGLPLAGRSSEPKEGCSYGPEWRLLEVVLLSLLVTLPLSMLPPPLGGHKDFVRQARSVTYKVLPLLAKSEQPSP